jgi:RNA polymerase sigma-70 factor, ECF subfamily
VDYEEELENEKNWLARTRVDPEKFFFFYEKYYDHILGYLYRITSDRFLAEDLTSETFLLAQQSLWRFRWQRSTFGGWLFKIASNQLRKHFRGKNVGQEVDEDRIEMVDPEPGALSLLLAREDLKMVLSEIEKLDETSRTILMLSVWQGLSHGEIAKLLRISEGAVKGRLFRSRQVLKEVLAAGHETLLEERPQVSNGGDPINTVDMDNGIEESG